MDFQLPQLGEGVYEAELVRWLVKPGTGVKHGQGLMEVLTDKATMEVPAPFAGTVTGLHAEAGQTVKVGDAVMSYRALADAAEELPAAPPPVVARAEPEPTDAATAVTVPTRANGHARTPAVAIAAAPVKASPSVRLLARKLGVDLAKVRGSGPGGRVLLDDLHVTHHGDAPAPPTVSVKVASSAVNRLDVGKAGTRQKMMGIRKKIAEHLVHSKRTAPHFTYVDECDITDLVRLRASLREPFEKAGVKLTFLPFFVKAVVAALKEVPIVNGTLDDATNEMIFHDHYHIGIATATPAGLVVPVVRDADRKDLAAIARDIERLSGDARANRSRIEDLRGGTFTITSIGGIGGLFATPIINHPEVAILGIGKAVKRPVFDAAGNVKAADMVYLSLSFDHRVVDGAVGAVFGNALIAQLQNPARLLLPEKIE